MSLTKSSHGMRSVLLALFAGLSLCIAFAAIVSTADAKKFRGTNGANRIIGTAKADVIRLKGGNDVGVGRGGNDRISGAAGKDRLKGSGGADVLLGGGKRDRLGGGKGTDRLKAGKGNDRINAVDGAKDGAVNGGSGNNVCRIDDVDLSVVSGCTTLIAVDGGGSGGRGGSGGGGGDPEGPGQKLELDTAEGLSCDDASLACTFQLTGGGADQPVGTVTTRGGITLGGGGAVNATDGEWTAAGGYQCTDDGFLVVTFGAETLDVPVNCI